MTVQIKLWVNNQRKLEWSIEAEELAIRFWEWEAKEKVTDSWPLDRCIRKFITDSEEEGGLQSVFDEDQYNDIYSSIRNAWPSETDPSDYPVADHEDD